MRGNEQRQASVGFGSGSAPTLTPERRRYRTHRCISARRARAARYGGTSQCTAVITGVTRHSRQRRRRVLATMQACGPRFPTLARATTGENVLDRRRSVFVTTVIHTHKTRTDCTMSYMIAIPADRERTGAPGRRRAASCRGTGSRRAGPPCTSVLLTNMEHPMSPRLHPHDEPGRGPALNSSGIY